MENEIYEYFRQAQLKERKQLKREWFLDRLIEVMCMVIVVFAVVMIMMSMAGTP